MIDLEIDKFRICLNKYLKKDYKLYSITTFDNKELIPKKFYVSHENIYVKPKTQIYRVILYDKDRDWSRELDDYVYTCSAYELIMFKTNDRLWYIPYKYELVKHDDIDIIYPRLDDLYHHVPIIDETNEAVEFSSAFLYNIEITNEDEFDEWNYIRQYGMTYEEYLEYLDKILTYESDETDYESDYEDEMDL